MSGPVSFSPSGEGTWDQATLNRPLSNGDRLWSDAGGRAEIQVGGAMVRLNANTGVSVLNMDDRIAQLQLTQGVLNVRVRRLQPNQVFEVDTPNLAFTLRQPADYRIEVDPDGNATTILMRRGRGEVYGEGTSYVIDTGQPYRFTGTDLSEEQLIAAPRVDDFDRWASDRDRVYDSSISARYVSPDVVGFQDLDSYGSWRVDASYGNVWTPNRVSARWAPYRDGHWAWVDPWGWTWVDDAPWGFAVSHYGRWANIGGSWGWVPGPARMPAYYAPALVAFVGGANLQLTISSGSVGGVAWFPLAPREVYRPSYAVSRGYFERVNSSNTVINNTVIQNTYNTTRVTNVVYTNRSVPGAVVAVPTTIFVQSQPVARAAVPVNRDVLVSPLVAPLPAVARPEKSVRGAAAQADKPPPRVFDRVAVPHAIPPAPQASLAAQQPQLSAQTGKSLDNASSTELKTAPAAAAPRVKVVAQAQQTPPTQHPPAAARGNAPSSADARSNERKVGPSAPQVSTTPGAPPPAAPPSAAAPPAAMPQAAAAPAARKTPDEGPAKTERQPKSQARGQDEGPAHSRAQSQPQASPISPLAEPRSAAPAQVPPRQAAQPRMAAPPIAPAAATPPSNAGPVVAPTRPSAVTQPQAQRARPDPATAAGPSEAGLPVAAPKPVPRQAAPQEASKEPPQPAHRPRAVKPNDKGGGENRRDEPDGKQKG
jgi:hypothetical protein